MLTIEEIRNKVTPILRKNNINKAILFGSHAEGNADINSDIDLLVNSNAEKLDMNFFVIANEIEEALEKVVDLFESREIIPNSLIEAEIQEKGVLIYEN